MNSQEMTPAEIKQIATEILGDLRQWKKNCHAASLALVRAGLCDRVARGVARFVGPQHSWGVIGNCCYSDDALIVDPTIWSHLMFPNPCVLIHRMGNDDDYKPKGIGSIWDYGKPTKGEGPEISLTPETHLSKAALDFLSLIGPLDAKGWMRLANCPVQGWPSAEIMLAIHQTEEMSAFVPIDVLGMLTDVNPGGFYLREDDHVN